MSDKYCNAKKDIDIGTLTLFPTQMVTIFLHESAKKTHQVELRITADGFAQIILDADDRPQVLDYSEVYK